MEKEKQVTRSETGRPVYQFPLTGMHPFHVLCGEIAPFPSHWHGELEMIYVLNGNAGVTVDSQKWDLTERDCLFVSSGAFHSVDYVYSKDKSPCILVLEMGFPLLGANFSIFARKQFVKPLIRFSGETPSSWMQELEARCLNISQESATMEEHKPEGKHYLTSSLRVCAGLYQIAALLAENMPMIDSPLDREQRMQSMTAVQPVLRFVRESYGQAITIQRAAAMAGYEKTRFCQLFKQAVGISFHRYLTSYRMESARSLLQETSLPITSIADLVGISQPKTFSRLFRAAYHTTPTEYRNCIKEGNTTR